jgi:hypothetical protein
MYLSTAQASSITSFAADRIGSIVLDKRAASPLFSDIRSSGTARKAAPVLLQVLLPVPILLALSWFTFLGKNLSGATDVPGDLGDARFNIYILEHVYRWLTGAAPSLLSPPMFHPYPYTLGFSDNHVGSVVFYALFRVVGADPYDAFRGWFVIGYFGTFVAAYIVLLRLRIEPWIAGLGAFLFAFSLPAVAQIGHAQLAYRWAVPFAVWHTLRLARTGGPGDLYKLAVAVSFQFLCSIYLGLFLVIYCAILAVVLAWPSGRPSPAVLYRARDRARDAVDRFRARLASGVPKGLVATAVVLTAAALLDLAFHFFVSRRYGLSRDWNEIHSMLPRAQSYLLMDNLPYWSALTRRLPPVPTRHEHQLFLGVPAVALFLAALAGQLSRASLPDRRTRQVMRALTVTVAVAFGLFLAVGPASVYRVMAAVPGIGAIRAVTRHILVGAFPVVAVGCLYLSGLRAQPRWSRYASASTAMFIVWHAVDMRSGAPNAFSSADARQRIAGPAKAIRAGGYRPDNVLAYSEIDPGDQSGWFLTQIDAMFVAQSLGMPTLNGYSGHAVPGHDINASCFGFQRQLLVYREWSGRKGPDAPGWREPLVFGRPCAIERNSDLRITMGPGLTMDAAKAVRLSILSRERVPGGWQFVLRVSNNSKEIIHAAGRNPFRLSWKSEAAVGWSIRSEILADIPAGGHLDIPVQLRGGGAAPPDVRFSFVVEGLFWGHDIGVPPV